METPFEREPYRVAATRRCGARFFPPQGVTVGQSGVFRIDHDEIFNQTTHLQLAVKTGPWFNWRYTAAWSRGRHE